MSPGVPRVPGGVRPFRPNSEECSLMFFPSALFLFTQHHRPVTATKTLGRNKWRFVSYMEHRILKPLDQFRYLLKNKQTTVSEGEGLVVRAHSHGFIAAT